MPRKFSMKRVENKSDIQAPEKPLNTVLQPIWNNEKKQKLPNRKIFCRYFLVLNRSQ